MNLSLGTYEGRLTTCTIEHAGFFLASFKLLATLDDTLVLTFNMYGGLGPSVGYPLRNGRIAESDVYYCDPTNLLIFRPERVVQRGTSFYYDKKLLLSFVEGGYVLNKGLTWRGEPLICN